MENIIVILVVAIAAVFIGRSFYQKFNKKNNSCACGCSSCPTDLSACELPEAHEHLITKTGRKQEK